MSSTTLQFEEARAGVTPGYRPSGRPDEPLLPTTLTADSAMLVPVRGLYSSTRDLASLAAALVNDGVVGGARVPAPGVAATVMQKRVRIPGTERHIGFGVRTAEWMGRAHVRASGSGQAHAVLLSALPDEHMAVVVATNTAGALLDDVADFVFRRLLALGESPRRMEQVAPSADASSVLAELARVPGTYRNGAELLEIVLVEGRPALRSDDLLLELESLPDGSIAARMQGRRAFEFRLMRDV